MHHRCVMVRRRFLRRVMLHLPITRAMQPSQDLQPRQMLYILRVWMSVLSVAMMFVLRRFFSRLLALIAASLAFLASAMRLSACLLGIDLRRAQSFVRGTRLRRAARSLHSFAGTEITLRSDATPLSSTAVILSRRLDG